MKNDERTVRILVLVGTDHHPFNRLVRLVDHWFGEQLAAGRNIRCLIQYGTSAASTSAEGRAYLEKSAIDSEIAHADMVVCHGGPSTIVEVLRSGKLPLVMARDPQYGEHVDRHQMRFAAHMAKRGLIVPVSEAADLSQGFADVLVNEYGEVLRGLDLPSPDDSARRLGALVQDLLSASRARRR